MSKITGNPARPPERRYRGEYVVTCDALEIPRGSYFVTLPIPVNRGDLALFEICDFMLVGRWYPSPDGVDWIQLPGLRIELAGEAKASFQIVGAVAPVEMTVKTITDLREAEIERFLESPFPRSLDS
jgi:hypothetical protein